MSDAASRADIEALIEASSFGTPEAKAARESVPPEIGVAITLAARYLARAEKAERERDEARRDLAYAKAALKMKQAKVRGQALAKARKEKAATYARGRDEALAAVEDALGEWVVAGDLRSVKASTGFADGVLYVARIVRELREGDRTGGDG